MIRSIAVVGNDIHAWMAATWLATHLSPHSVSIHICTQHSTAPLSQLCLGYDAFKRFLQIVEIDETQFIKQTDASITLANHFVDWPKPEHDFYHATAEYGVRHIAEFHHLAKHLEMEGRLKRYDDYSLGATAARASKFQPPSSAAGDIMASYDYGYQFRADRCCDMLREQFSQIEQCRVYDEPIASVQTAANGCVTSIVLDTGEEVQVDLFIDCAGSVCAALPHSSERADWTDYFPVSHLHSETASHVDPRPSVTLQRMPDRVVKTLRSRNQCLSESYFFTGFTPANASRGSLTLQPGARCEAWTNNCIALGPALVTLPFLIGSDVEATLEILMQLDRLYPRDPADEIIAAEFNRVISEYLARLRDSQTLLFSLTGWPNTGHTGATNTDGKAHAMPNLLSPELEWKLELYRTFGKMPAYEQEPVDDADWVSLLAGLGIWPQRDDMIMQSRSSEELLHVAQQVSRLVADRVERMPTLKQWLRRCCGDAY